MKATSLSLMALTFLNGFERQSPLEIIGRCFSLTSETRRPFLHQEVDSEGENTPGIGEAGTARPRARAARVHNEHVSVSPGCSWARSGWVTGDSSLNLWASARQTNDSITELFLTHMGYLLLSDLCRFPHIIQPLFKCFLLHEIFANFTSP